MFNILNYTATFVFATQHRMKRVTIAVFNCVSSHSLCCLMNRKGKSFKQCFHRNNKLFFFGFNSYNTSSKGVFIATQLNSTELNSAQRPVYDVINKNTTDLLRADWLYAVQLGQFSWVQMSSVVFACVVVKWCIPPPNSSPSLSLHHFFARKNWGHFPIGNFQGVFGLEI